MSIPVKKVAIGGLTKPALLQELADHDVLLNPLGEKLFADEDFQLSTTSQTVNIVEITVAELGLSSGGRLSQIFKQGEKAGFVPCPTELGPYLRLAYLEQPEVTATGKQHKAPEGSLTIISPIIKESDEFPKGFYLRNIDGQLWLRGYICDDLHQWNPTDRLIFALK